MATATASPADRADNSTPKPFAPEDSCNSILEPTPENYSGAGASASAGFKARYYAQPESAPRSGSVRIGRAWISRVRIAIGSDTSELCSICCRNIRTRASKSLA
ncbi:MAG: hypothetical protein F6J93_04155 [Oscillatoria sp. SIO1A7]|nr:hypothetical protein [Oscillatoria sp. SIO1A7]